MGEILGDGDTLGLRVGYLETPGVWDGIEVVSGEGETLGETETLGVGEIKVLLTGPPFLAPIKTQPIKIITRIIKAAIKTFLCIILILYLARDYARNVIPA